MDQQHETRLVRHRYRCPHGHAYWERRETDLYCLTRATRGLADPQFERRREQASGEAVAPDVLDCVS